MNVKFYFKPKPSKWSSSSQIERLSTCNKRSKVSLDNRMWDALKPRKNVLYSNVEAIAIKSLNMKEKSQNTY